MKKMFNILGLTISLLVLVTFKGQSTTIVIIVTSNSVVLGTDSRGTFYDYLTKKEEKKSVTKIYKSSQYHFAVAGLTYNPNTKFNAPKIIDYYLKSQNDIMVAIDSLKLNLSRLLFHELKSQKKDNPDAFLRTIKTSNIVLSFGIVGIKDSRPFAHLIGFQIQDTSTLNIKVLEDSCPGNCPKGVKVFWMGQADAIAKYMKKPDGISMSPVLLVEKLINLEIQNKSQFVGPPIDILEIKNGLEIWHRKKNDCPIVLDQN